ncbi:long chain acyl-CoA synthetase 8-like [Phoenix dactylifera]|uniref:Long chain acyl-CoA synthetase 8-like n=1 Tax=Phoenix dactylifera TaxID=42345 RepID=A0A8B8ZFH8_PHODC|nr:long chain acyl-CoA synthetase 8-like [Phoenix dactylifera]
MGDTDRGHLHFAFLESISRSYISVVNEYRLHGIVGAAILGLILPLVVSSLYVLKKKNKQRAVQINVGGEPGITMRHIKFSSLVEVPWEGATTVAALFEQSCKKHTQRRFLGARKLISREVVDSADGRKFEKLHLGEYRWQTYGVIFDRACNFASGLIKMSHIAERRATIFSDSRAEWFIALQVDM